MEVSSEFPFSNNNWPSDITFSLNGVELGTWTSPGDFADIRGKYTPDWYPDNLNQYGLLKTIRIMDHGTYMEGVPFRHYDQGYTCLRRYVALKSGSQRRCRACRRLYPLWQGVWELRSGYQTENVL